MPQTRWPHPDAWTTPAFPGLAPGPGRPQTADRHPASALDPQWTIHDAIAEDDLVVLRWSLTGTHRGEFLDIPPTGKMFVFRGIDMYRVQDGKIAEHWNVVDMSAFCQQDRALPTAAR